MHNPIVPVPEGTKKGWKWLINGVEMIVDSIVGSNPNVGEVLYGFNGRYDQPAINQLPGRLVVYICNHPVHGLLMGGADEPRQLANGEMFTTPGGFDANKNNSEYQKILALPDGDDKIKKLAEYGMKQAAREALEETGLKPTKLHFAGRSISNRAFFICDLKEDPKFWNGETIYVCVVPPDLLGPDLTINLPESRIEDVTQAPEWASIKKLQFMSVLGCFGSPAGVAVTAYAKALRWWKMNQKEVI